MSQRYGVRIPADVDRPDRVLAGLTARQVAILAATAAAVYLGWLGTRTVVPLMVFGVVALPVAVAGIALAWGRRDGMGLEELARAALAYRLRPTLLRHHPGPLTPAPAWAAARAQQVDQPTGRSGALRLPARDVGQNPHTPTPVAAIDLGRDGVAVIAAASTVNFALRTDSEQDALVECFARLLHSQPGHTQILIRTRPVDLGPACADLAEAATALPHPALRWAAAGHHHWLAALAGTRTLWTRQVLLVLREPAAGGMNTAAMSTAAKSEAGARLARRLDDLRRVLATAEITVTALDVADATSVLAAATDPTHPHTPPGLTGAPGVGASALLTQLLHPHATPNDATGWGGWRS